MHLVGFIIISKNSEVDSYIDKATDWKTDESAFFPDVDRDFSSFTIAFILALDPK